jgi:hypothetical protein
MMEFLRGLFFRVVYGVPYHEHQWAPSHGSGWGCTYQTKGGKTCTAYDPDEIII